MTFRHPNPRCDYLKRAEIEQQTPMGAWLTIGDDREGGQHSPNSVKSVRSPSLGGWGSTNGNGNGYGNGYGSDQVDAESALNAFAAIEDRMSR